MSCVHALAHLRRCAAAALPSRMLCLRRKAAVQSAGRRAAVVLQEDLNTKTVIKDAEKKLKKSLASVTEQLSTIRVGRATSDMLDRVQVEYYGAPTPLNQLASVTTPSASQLVVDAYDKSCLGDIERALMESDLGMTPNNDGNVIRLNVPSLTAERRKELAKTASKIGEEGKVALRNVRRDAIDKIKKMQKDGLSEDESRDAQDELQKSLKKYESEIDSSVSQREKEIMTI
uniref:Ribosome recycling factor domain-containing protein n=1 Tax=Chrysotila carterae TaxID=13221 RepID=A0A7S4EWH4_CHRCT